MNWLERARREIPKSARRRTANSAERNLTAVMAGLLLPFARNWRGLSAVTAVSRRRACWNSNLWWKPTKNAPRSWNLTAA
jgi:hypothetical protein